MPRAGDAAILLGIVRFQRIVQLIEEDRQVAVIFAQCAPPSIARNSSRHRNIFLSMNYCYDTTLTEIKIHTR
jgi:hypothetical protein